MQNTTTPSQTLSVDPALEQILAAHAVAHNGATENAADEHAASETAPGRVHPVSTPDFGWLHRVTRGIEQHLRPRVRLFGRTFSAYNLFGLGGMALAASIALGLTVYRGLSIPLMISLLLLALLISAIHIVLTVLRTGKDSLVFLRYFLSIMAVAALLLRILEQPILPYLENLMLGIGAMQGIGRIGCLRVGCCYGKPARYGIRYAVLHARAGFPDPLVGVRLFPVQLVESCWILFSRGVGIYLAIRHPVAGYGLASYLVLFSMGRFCLELLRGDTARTYTGLFSEAQWLSMFIVAATVTLEIIGVLPYAQWHAVLGAGFLLLFLFLQLYYFHTGPAQLRKPQNLHALARTIQVLNKGRQDNLAGTHAVHLRKAPSGLQISDGLYTQNQVDVHHYTVSYAAAHMPLRDAQTLARVLHSWHDAEENAKLIHQNNNTFHILRYQSAKS